MRKQNLAVFVSGNGTTLQAIIDACTNGLLKSKASIVLVISSKEYAFALERAEKAKIPHYYINPKPEDSTQRMLSLLFEHGVDFIFLAGYTALVPSEVVKQFSGRMVNTHPSLLPKYGGKGMYGTHVYEMILNAGENETGVTVHFVTDRYDEGDIIAQVTVAISPSDTVASLRERVQSAERILYVSVIDMIISSASN